MGGTAKTEWDDNEETKPAVETPLSVDAPKPEDKESVVDKSE